MIDKQKDAKQRILNAALSLFPHKGYAAVGIREIAREAGVNVSMISYYFQGKAGILNTIVNDCFEKYYNTIKAVGDENTPLEEHVRLMTRAIVKFFRENTELAVFAFNVIPIDIPETMDLKVKLGKRMREGMSWFHKKIGIDPSDPIQASLGPGIIFEIVLYHFQNRHAAEHFPQLRKRLAGLDDEFYDRYSESLANLYLCGIKGLVARNQPKRRKQK